MLPGRHPVVCARTLTRVSDAAGMDWANRDLNVGAIIALAPDLSAVTKMLGVATVRDVIEHYEKFFRLSLSEAEKTDLAAYLLSL